MNSEIAPQLALAPSKPLASEPGPHVTDESDSRTDRPLVPHLPTDVAFGENQEFLHRGSRVVLRNVLTLDRLVVCACASQTTYVVNRAELTPIATSLGKDARSTEELDTVTEEQMKVATARQQALEPYLAGSSKLSQVAARQLARQFQVDVRTVRRWCARFRRVGDVTAFFDMQRGRRAGQTSLDKIVEAIIDSAVRTQLNQSGNCSVRAVYERIKSDCEVTGRPSPARGTVLARIKALKSDPDALPPDIGKKLRDRKALVRGTAEVTGALQRVEIDHTLVDTHLIDARDGGPIGRAWLTMAMCWFTRMILGIVLTLEHPSRLSVALCMRHAIFPKESWMAEVGAVGSWPAFGRMRNVYTDNGAEFRSLSFRLGCRQQNIAYGYRPVRTPRYGGRIERLLGTFMKRMRLIPGNTFNEILNTKSPYPQQHAVLTLKDLQRWFANEIVAYHNERHSVLGCPPIVAWERAWQTPHGIVLPHYPKDPWTLFTNMLPHVSRCVYPEGVLWNGLRYRCPELEPFIQPEIKQVFRYDPRDISAIYMRKADGAFTSIPWTQPHWPRLSLWEWNEIRRRDGKRDKVADAAAVRAAMEDNERLIAERVSQGQLRARRRRARQDHWPDCRDPSSQPGPAARTVRTPRRSEVLTCEVEALAPLPRTQLEVTVSSTESAIEFEVLE
jgi:putative transposase